MPPSRRIAVAGVVAACGSTGASSRSPRPDSRRRRPEPLAIARAFDPAGLRVTLESVATGLDAPLAIVNAHDGSNRLFVAEQGGRIRIVKDGTLQPAPFLDVSDRITSGGERGLLGLAFHPGFPADPRLFVDYTDPNGDTQVSSFTRRTRPRPTRPTPRPRSRSSTSSSRSRTTTAARSSSGRTASSSSRSATVDRAAIRRATARTPQTLLGKILRIDVDEPVRRPPVRDPAGQPVRRRRRRRRRRSG